MQTLKSLASTILLLIAVPLAAQTPAPQGEPTSDRLAPLVEALGRLKFSGYVQAQYVDAQDSRDELTGNGTRNKDQFSIRRGRIKLTYKATDTSRAVVQFDTSSSGTELKEGFVELSEPWSGASHKLTVGQFAWPFGFEVSYSSAEREVPEHSRVVRTLFPGEYDRGVMLSADGIRDRFHYRAAVVNGTGIRESFDRDSGKDLVGRLAWDFGPVSAGVSGYTGEALVATASVPSGEFFDKERYGIDVQTSTPVPGLKLRGELITGEEGGADVMGWYVYAIEDFGERHQIAVRLDEYDPDTNIDGNAILTSTLAYNFQWDKHTKLMLAIEDPRREENDIDDRALTARVQFKF